MKTVRLIGASVFDVSFELDFPGLPNIIWNVTRMQADAKLGKFGKPKKMPISALPPLDKESWANLDQKKVHAIIAKNDPAVIDSPIIAVIFDHEGVYHCMIVDGNHRFTARYLLGKKDFLRYEVPPELEGNYRVTLIED
jgi:hypothetical protein